MKHKYDIDKIRNFSIIAHIDHGKSTIADRLLEETQTVSQREMQEQLLDDMDLERERGITIKAHPVTMYYTSPEDGQTYQINFIDTPGHVDFSYEVSRSLSACEGALLIVDAAQGVQAQTLANVNLAIDKNLEITPVLNKIDLPAADPEKAAKEIEDLVGISASGCVRASAKTGQGIKEILEEIVYSFPAPKKPTSHHLQALVFDSHYDTYRGVMAYVRIMSGEIKKKDEILFMQSGKKFEVLEVGIFTPKEVAIDVLRPGEVGYIVAGIKDPAIVQIGDTITLANDPTPTPLEGFKKISPVVFAGIYPVDTSDFELVRDAFKRLRLNDSALQVEQESSLVLGTGFRCGFLGLLHLEITFERLSREFDLSIITTAPSVLYKVKIAGGSLIDVESPIHFPDPATIEYIEEPMILANIISPSDYLGNIMSIANDKRGELIHTESIDSTRLMLKIRFPLNEVITDFNDKLKSMTQGYASFDFTPDGYERSNIVKLDIKVNEEPVDAFSTLVHSTKAETKGRALCEKLKEVIPRQQFKIPIQAAIGGKIIGRETIGALSKNVTAKCYGGDISRKRKLWEKQKKGKKKMKEFGKVSIPQSAFIKILKST
ncbi:MAG: translation elongation factor 4 [Rhabdochlamydiaceae bacterium]|nr:translation elongation factor 4 [Candidatus Amphrikana amoebophyrae]